MIRLDLTLRDPTLLVLFRLKSAEGSVPLRDARVKAAHNAVRDEPVATSMPQQACLG
jgi:hypothetical protein